MRLQDIKKGDIIHLDNPRRIGRIEGRVHIEFMNTKEKEIEERPAVKVLIAMPTMVIEGFVGKQQAARGERLAQAAEGSITPSGKPPQYGQPGCSRLWTEIWAERSVPNIIHRGKYIELSEKEFHKELYCHSEEGRTSAMMVTSPSRRKRITGQKIDRQLVPKELFEPKAETTGVPA